MKQTKFAETLALLLGVLVFSSTASYLIFAWNPPGQTPPGDNVDAPINIGEDPQGKLGNLGIGTTSPGAKLDIADNGTAAGAQFLRVGDDTFLTDIDIAHTLGIYSQGDSTIASIKLGSNGGIISGRNNNIGIGTSSPDGTLYVARGTANGGTAVFAGTTNKSHFNYSVDEDTYIRGGKASSKVIINDNGGNVGIGTAAPAQKLDVRGHMTTSGILELTQQGTGNRHSFIDFHGDDTYTDYGLRIIRWNSGPNTDSAIEHRGSGTFRILTPDANSNIVLQPNKNVGVGPIDPTQKLDVDGYVKGRAGLCIGNDCCSTWKECFELSGITPPGPTLPPGAENKRIFVTSIAYDSNQLFDRIRADQICQKHAKNLEGTYKALIYYCTTNTTPYVALPAGARFWNCSTTDCFEVAENPMDFFTKNTGDNNYLKNPIKYDETGATSPSSVAVWTGFTPDGSGGWTGQLCSPTGTPQGLCFSPKGTTAYTIYGSNFSKDIGWASFATASYPNPSTCLSQSRALYCVEQ